MDLLAVGLELCSCWHTSFLKRFELSLLFFFFIIIISDEVLPFIYLTCVMLCLFQGTMSLYFGTIICSRHVNILCKVVGSHLVRVDS